MSNVTLGQLLQPGQSFDCELFAAWDMPCSFIWNADVMVLSPTAVEEFSRILELPVKFHLNGNIEVLVGEDPGDTLSKEVERFTNAVAGACQEVDFVRWFPRTDWTVLEYGGYKIQVKRDFGEYPQEGYVVTDGFCNIMPGATWFPTVSQAKIAIDIFNDVGGDGALFWERVHSSGQF